MQLFPLKKHPKVIVLRHAKENIKKCSLRGLEKREDFHFLTYPKSELPDLAGYLLLTLDAPPLSQEDRNQGLFILDGTWRYVQEKLLRYVLERQQPVCRRLPDGWRTAYPRRQPDCPLPEIGLASLEAIYAAYVVMGRDCTGLLDHYYWKDAFLEKNKAIQTQELDLNVYT
ncbi:MAG: hypothetical protein WB791_09965 [Waddliaceae bacterium]